jgi:hypothetical protein
VLDDAHALHGYTYLPDFSLALTKRAVLLVSFGLER